MSDTPVLARYIGDPSTFLAEYWGKKILHRPSSDHAALDALITVADVDRLISSTLPHYPDVNLVKDGMQIEPAQFSHAPDPRRGGARVIDAARVFEYFHGGATIQMQGIHFRHPPLADFCRQLEIELTVPVQANMYITPPHSRGLGLHDDKHDVLVLQVAGTKRWEVFDPVPPGTDLDDPANEPPLQLDTELAQGDVLYVPRGVPHRVESTTATSIHLTIGFLTPSWADVVSTVVDRTIAEIGREPAFRETLPAGFAVDHASVAGTLADRLRLVADRIAQVDAQRAAELVAQRFWADRSPILTGQLGQLIDLPDLNRDTVLMRRPAAIAQRFEQNGTLTVVLGDRSLELPSKLRDALDFVLAKTTFTLADLDPYLDQPSQLVFVKRLVREGLLVQR
jgi:ribosomal protein L16 Arg81 hydroxylase